MPKKGELVKAVANWLNRLGYQSTRYAFPVKVQLRDAKNILSLPIAFLSRSRPNNHRPCI